MGKSAQILVVLSLISLASGVSLGALDGATREQIDNNVLKFKKIPAVLEIHESAIGPLGDAERRDLEAALLADRRLLPREGLDDLLFFVLRDGGNPRAVVVESFGAGYGGDVGVMTAFDLDGSRIAGIGITTLSETPGVGTEVRSAGFRRQFVGFPLSSDIRVKKDGGQVDAITGATMSSRAVAAAIRGAIDVFEQNRDALVQAAQTAAPAAGEAGL